MYKELVKDMHLKKSFSNVVHAIFEYNHVDLANEGDFLQNLKTPLSQLMNLQKSIRKNVELDFYGLTGTGLQFRDRPLKVICRHSKFKELL